MAKTVVIDGGAIDFTGMPCLGRPELRSSNIRVLKGFEDVLENS